MNRDHITMAPLEARGLKPTAVLAANRPHGDRLRYIAGCRCDLCRRANSAYENERQKARKAGDWNGIVPADKARAHIEKLSRQGVGRRAISAASDVAETVLFAIKSGTKTKIRARTERRVLAVTREQASDHALVSAAPTWRLIDELREAGFTKRCIAAALGQANGGLQLGKVRCTVRNAADVKRVHEALMRSGSRLVPAEPTWRLIDQLRDEGFTDKQLARHFGFVSGEIDIHKTKITAAVAEQVAEAHGRLMA